MRTAARAEASIKQLCSLGLPSEAVMPMLAQKLRALFPCVGVTFFWSNESGGLANFYDEHPDSHRSVRLFLQEFYNRRELGLSFQEVMRACWGVHSREEVQAGIDLNEYLASDQYNLTLRPIGYGGYICLIVHTPDSSIGLGSAMLNRGPTERPFTEHDRRRLAQLEPFLAHLLINSSDSTYSLINSKKTGCCSIADCHRTKARVDVHGRWWTLLQAEWWPEPRWVAVPPESVLTSPRSIDGEAYVCQTAGSRRALSPINGIAAPIDPVVRCFVPPDLGS